MLAYEIKSDMMITALAEDILRWGVLVDIGFSDFDILVKVGISFDCIIL